MNFPGGIEMPDDIRMKRIASFFRTELTRIVTREFKNPLFDKALITFSDIRISKDLSNAQVDVSVFGDGDLRTQVGAALNKATKLIRREIMNVSDLRKIPEFTFHEDRTIEMAAKMDQILDSLEIPPEEEPDETE